jgi:hypothetical protein
VLIVCADHAKVLFAVPKLSKHEAREIAQLQRLLNMQTRKQKFNEAFKQATGPLSKRIAFASTENNISIRTGWRYYRHFGRVTK